MVDLIGIGKSGASILESLSRFGVYNTVSIDVENDYEVDHKIVIEEQKTDSKKHAHEKYEEYWFENKLSLRPHLQEDEVYVFINGGSKVSGITLSALSTIADKDITVVYIKPDKHFLSNMEQKQERVTFHVLQEYARSGRFKNIIIIDSTVVDKLMASVPVAQYYEYFNSFVSNIFHTWVWCQKNTPLMEQKNDVLDYTRVCTFGIRSEESEDDIMLYDLKYVGQDSKGTDIIYPLEMHYYYIYNQDKLQEDSGLLVDIKESIREKKENYASVGYSIYEAEEESIISFIKTSKVQQEQL